MKRVLVLTSFFYLFLFTKSYN